jgi:hypothetical protein
MRRGNVVGAEDDSVVLQAHHGTLPCYTDGPVPRT